MNKNEPLAEKIARMLESDTQPNDLAALFASIEKINHRLDKIESGQSAQPSIRTTPQLIHPSTDKFSVAEAVADDIFIGFQKEKACTFEPNGKPCDHCAMCSSRGF